MIGRNRKAIAAAVLAFFGALGAGVVEDGITGTELFLAAAAALVAFAGTWATAANDPPAPSGVGEGVTGTAP